MDEDNHPFDRPPMWDLTGMSPPRIPHAYGIPVGTARTGITVECDAVVRQFSGGEIGRVNTTVKVDLPYCLHGLPEETLSVYIKGIGMYTVLLTHLHRPKEVVEHMLGKVDNIRTASPNELPIDLEDDAWGRTSYSSAIVTLPFYCPVWSNSSFGWGIFRDIGGYHAEVHGAQDDPFVVVNLLSRACYVLNRVVKIYIAHTFRFELRPLHPYDFLQFEAWHSLDGEQLNHVKFHGLHNLVYQSKEHLFSAEVMASIRDNLESPGLKLVDNMLLNARTNIELGERRASIIMAVTALETALGEFVTRRLRVLRTNERRAKQLRERLGVWHMLNTLLPLIINQKEIERLETWHSFDQVIKRLNRTISTRNDIVHRGRVDIEEREAEISLADISRFIDFLNICSS